MVWFIIASLAVWRFTHMLQNEQGRWDMVRAELEEVMKKYGLKNAAGGDGWPNNFPTALTRVAAGHWTFEAPKIFYEDDHLLPGHGLDYRPTMAIASRGALTAGFYITVYASDTTIHVECWNSSDAYVDPNVAVDITVTMHARVIAV